MTVDNGCFQNQLGGGGGGAARKPAKTLQAGVQGHNTHMDPMCVSAAW